MFYQKCVKGKDFYLKMLTLCRVCVTVAKNVVRLAVEPKCYRHWIGMCWYWVFIRCIGFLIIDYG